MVSGGFTPDQRRRVDQMISAFENRSTTVQYGFASNLGDGRGVTAGRADFATATGDAALVVDAYTKAVPHNQLARFLPELQRLARTHSAATGGLPQAAFIRAWKAAAADTRFRSAQDATADRLYFRPAIRRADQAGLRTPLARAEIYDAVVQHGNGAGADSVGALLASAKRVAGGTPATGVKETVWLKAFLKVRLADLTNPADRAVRAEWRRSVDRVTAFQQLLAAGNLTLSGPIRFSSRGAHFTVR
jgi:chitosanase